MAIAFRTIDRQLVIHFLMVLNFQNHLDDSIAMCAMCAMLVSNPMVFMVAVSPNGDELRHRIPMDWNHQRSDVDMGTKF